MSYLRDLEVYGLSIAKGDISGHSVVLKFGRNADIDGAVEETVWDGGGTYTFDTTAQSLEIVSDDVNDDGDPASTGALTATVHGLDGSYVAKSETVTLNGTTAVALSGTWLRVNRALVATAGSSETNEGTLTIRLAGAGATRAIVSPLNGQTLMAVYTIPAGYTGYMLNYYASANAQVAAWMDIKLFTRTSAGVKNLKHQQALSAGISAHKFGIPFSIAEKTDVWIDATSSANNTDVCAGFDIVLVTN